MYLSIIGLPLLASAVTGFFGRKVGIVGGQIITCTSVLTSTFFAIVAFFEVGFNNIPVSIYLFRWIDSEWYNIDWGFQFDSLTVSMLLPVLIISSLVHIYSIFYMSHDPHNQRFFSYLSLFTFMMIILVTANNYLLMFVGWEGVGVCSYLLVSFWFTRIAANQSSISAFLTNRVGDCFLTLGMIILLWSIGNLDYATVFSLAPYINENIITIIGICLLIGAMAKSSQVGLHIWLPMAMEGPTPVSALIHAATMVTAGVYLLMRSSPLIEYSSTVLLLCLWLGAITTVFSSLVGLFQQDIKKVIAYSTMSQLGMMVIAIGLSSYNIALFHLMNHAFYKALLFLGAGSVIHAVKDNQDFRKYGGLIGYLPLTYSVMLIASLSLVAIPYMTGFYSKDFILESAYGQFSFSGITVYIIATIGAIFTTLYSVKVLYLTFLALPNGPRTNYDYYLFIDNYYNKLQLINRPARQDDEKNLYLALPFIILALFSIFFGYITKDIFIGIGSDFFVDNSLFIHPLHEIVLDTEFAMPIVYKLLPFIFTVLFIIIGLGLSELLPKFILAFKFSRLGYNIFGFFNQKFLIELFYNVYIINLVLNLGGLTTKVLDKGSIEQLGPYGLERGLIFLSKGINSLSTNIVTDYALFIFAGFALYILILNYSLISFNFFILLFISFMFLFFDSKNLRVREILKFNIIESKMNIFSLILKFQGNFKIIFQRYVFYIIFFSLLNSFWDYDYKLHSKFFFNDEGSSDKEGSSSKTNDAPKDGIENMTDEELLLFYNNLRDQLEFADKEEKEMYKEHFSNLKEEIAKRNLDPFLDNSSDNISESSSDQNYGESSHKKSVNKNTNESRPYNQPGEFKSGLDLYKDWLIGKDNASLEEERKKLLISRDTYIKDNLSKETPEQVKQIEARLDAIDKQEAANNNDKGSDDSTKEDKDKSKGIDKGKGVDRGNNI
jgi:NADH-ubiquinone oxidoreductase chain 5